MFAVINMYGKYAQVTLTDNCVQEARIRPSDMCNVVTTADVNGVIDLCGQVAQTTIIDLADFWSPDGQTGGG